MTKRKNKRTAVKPAISGRRDDAAQDRWAVLAAGCLIFVVTVAVYSQVWNHDFVNVDDPEYIVQNPLVNQGVTLSGVRSAFTEAHAGNWHPLTWLSHMVDCHFLGLDAGRHHLVNVVLHATNAVLLLAALRSMTGAIWPSVMVAAMFALHPLRVESVAWAAERKDVLSGLFWMLTMLAYARYVKRRSWRTYLLVLTALTLGLLAKPMLVTLPCVLLLLDFWPLGRWRRQIGQHEHAGEPTGRTAETQAEPLGRLILEKLPLLALALAAALFTVQAQQGGDLVRSVESLSVGTRLANASVAYVAYLGKIIWPSNLAILYPHPALLYADPLSVLMQPAIIAALVLAIVTCWICWMGRRYGYLPVGWFWFLGVLIPVSGVFQVGSQALADRFTYLPTIGLFIAIVWSAYDLVSRRPRIRMAVAAAGVALIVCWTTVTWFQLRHWKNSVTLFQHSLAVTTENGIVHNLLGTALFEEQRFREAANHLEKALQTRSKDAQLHYKLAMAYQSLGDDRDAIRHYRTTIELNPNIPRARNNLAWMLATCGDASLRDGTEAVFHAQQIAETTNYEDVTVLDTLAAALAESGDFKAAIKWQTKALKKAPVQQRPDFHERLELYQSGQPYRIETGQ